MTDIINLTSVNIEETLKRQRWTPTEEQALLAALHNGVSIDERHAYNLLFRTETVTGVTRLYKGVTSRKRQHVDDEDSTTNTDSVKSFNGLDNLDIKIISAPPTGVNTLEQRIPIQIDTKRIVLICHLTFTLKEVCDA